MALQPKKSNFKYEQKQPTPPYGNQGILGGSTFTTNNQPPKQKSQNLSPLYNVNPSTPNYNDSPSSNISNNTPQQPRHVRKLTLSRPIGVLSSQSPGDPLRQTPKIQRMRPPSHSHSHSSNRQRSRSFQRAPFHSTATTKLYGTQDIIKLISLSSRRGSVLLSQPFKRKKLTDARDRGLAKLRNENQKFQQKLEELQGVNRRLQVEKQRILTQNKEFESKTNKLEQYKHSLNNILSLKTQKEEIFWFKNEPIFLINKNENNITGMNMDLEVIEYKYNDTISNCISVQDKFESYLEKIVRSARIFQQQYFNILNKQTAMDEKQMETEKLQTSFEALRASKSNEIERLKVKLNNTLRDFSDEKKIIVQEHDEILHKEKEKMNDFTLKLQNVTAKKQELITKLEESQIKQQQIMVEKQRLEIDYGVMKKKLNVIETHPIIHNVKRVDERLVLKKIQRSFYDEIFDEKANIHQLAFEYLRKNIKNKTQFTTRYCKQMALKILFEIIHICYEKVNDKFVTIYDGICVHLGIVNGGGLVEALDFLLKYQFEEILDNLCEKMLDDVVEEIYEIEFDLISSHAAQNIFSFDLHESNNPMIRQQDLCEYIHKICVICFEMMIFSHKKKEKEKLIFYPTTFMNKMNENELIFDGDIYDKCTAHCEKKCDKILFYVFPIVMYAKDINNIFAALVLDEENDLKIDDHDEDMDESESKMDEDDENLEQESKIKIKVVTRKNIAKCLSKDIAPCMIGGGYRSKDPLVKIGGIKLLKKSPNMAVIREAFACIHKQQHKNLFEAIQELLEGDDDSDSDSDMNSDMEDEKNEEIILDMDGDMLDMKIYKILFNILVSCYMKIMDIIETICEDDLNVKQLEFDKRYHLLLNLQYYFNKFSKMEMEHGNINVEREIVMGLIEGIYKKYCECYTFLSSEYNKINEKSKIYIMKCCECCFHFGAKSILNNNEEVKEEDENVNDENEYGLYPLCFVRDSEYCSVISTLQEENLNNDIIDFKKVLMGTDDGLCIYNDIIHEKESNSDIECVINAKICYFTWPAIVTTNKNNQYIYGNMPKKYLTKIWVLLNNELYEIIYGNNSR